MNKNALKAKIVERGMNVEGFCKAAGFNRATFDRKMNGSSEFNRDEMERIIVTLKLTTEEMRNIFFPLHVA